MDRSWSEALGPTFRCVCRIMPAFTHEGAAISEARRAFVIGREMRVIRM